MLRQRNPDVQPDIVTLPDDVLIRILGHLDLINQLKMTHVHIRFLILMPQVWRSQCRSTMLSLIELHLSDKDLRFYLGSNQKTFQVLRLKMEKRGNFDILTRFVFPSTHDFRFSTSSFWLHDSDMPRIIKTFPNLITFSPHGIFTGIHLPDFPRLEHLTLTYCSNFQSNNLIPILETRKLRGLKLGRFDDEHFVATKLPLEGIRDLENLHCDTGEMDGWFMEHLQHLTKLKHLQFCGLFNWDVVKRVLNSSNRQSFKSVQLNTSGTDVFHFFHNIPVQIETLKVANAIIPLNRMPSRAVYFENINEIYFKNCAIPQNENFGILLKRLKRSEILGLEGCIFGFQDYTFLAQEIAKDRHTALHLHLNKNVYLDNMDKKLPMVWKVEGEHRLFQLHKESLSITYSSDSIHTVVIDNIQYIVKYVGLNTNWEGIKQLYLKKCVLTWESLDLLLSSFKTPDILGLDTCFCHFLEYTFDANKIASGRHTKLHIYLNENMFKYIDTSPIKWILKGQHRFLEVHMEEELNISMEYEGCIFMFD